MKQDMTPPGHISNFICLPEPRRRDAFTAIFTNRNAGNILGVSTLRRLQGHTIGLPIEFENAKRALLPLFNTYNFHHILH